jgi:hypothetical protein
MSFLVESATTGKKKVLKIGEGCKQEIVMNSDVR